MSDADIVICLFVFWKIAERELHCNVSGHKGSGTVRVATASPAAREVLTQRTIEIESLVTFGTVIR